MSTAQIFASTIARLQELSLAELSRLKLAVAVIALGDPDPDDADDNPNEEYYDAQTEAHLALLDLIDLEFERRKVVVTEVVE